MHRSDKNYLLNQDKCCGEIQKGRFFFQNLQTEHVGMMISDDFPASFTHVKTNKKICSFGNRGFIAFEDFFNTWVVAGEPISLKEDISKEWLLRAFSKKAHSLGKRVCGYYTTRKIADDEFSYFRIGVSNVVDIPKFNLEGKKFVEVRRALNQGKKSRLSFLEIAHKEKDKWIREISRHYKDWLSSKKQPEVKFLLSRPQNIFPYSEKERWFVVMRDGAIHAFASLLPCGTKSWYLDSSIQCIKSHKFALDFLLTEVCLLLKSERESRFYMGLNAFCIKNPKNRIEKVVLFGKKFYWPYRSSGLYFFKSKFTGREEERFFFIEKGKNFFLQMLAMFWVTFIGS